jgi:hypothetical protein
LSASDCPARNSTAASCREDIMVGDAVLYDTQPGATRENRLRIQEKKHQKYHHGKDLIKSVF